MFTILEKGQYSGKLHCVFTLEWLFSLFLIIFLQKVFLSTSIILCQILIFFYTCIYIVHMNIILSRPHSCLLLLFIYLSKDFWNIWSTIIDGKKVWPSLKQKKNELIRLTANVRITVLVEITDVSSLLLEMRSRMLRAYFLLKCSCTF